MAHLRPVLYSRWSSSCAWRVRNALQYKGIEYDSHHVRFEDQASPAFLKINPAGTVPVFVHGRTVLYESLAIIEFLDDEYPGTKKLVGGDSYDRALIRSISLQPLQNKGTLKHVNQLGLDDDAWARHFIGKGLEVVESRLRRSAGQYCVGDSVSMADVCLVPQVYNAQKKFDMDTDRFPLVTRIANDLLQLPAFARAHPLAQPDAPTSVKEKEGAL